MVKTPLPPRKISAATPEAEDDYVREIQLARELAEMGMDMARAVERRLKTAPPADFAELALEFERACETVCTNIELEDRLAREHRARQDQAGKARAKQTRPGGASLH